MIDIVGEAQRVVDNYIKRAHSAYNGGQRKVVPSKNDRLMGNIITAVMIVCVTLFVYLVFQLIALH